MKERPMTSMLGRVMAVGFFVFCLLFTGESHAAALLKIGDRGVEVRQMQEILAAQGYLSGKADGVFGSATVAALKRFQTAAGLKSDGICGEDTMNALKTLAADPTYALPGCVVKQGMHGEGVVIVQQILRDYGYYKSEIDGKCGPGTIRAIKNFQRDYGLVPDGVCGRATYAVMEEAYEGSAVDPNDDGATDVNTANDDGYDLESDDYETDFAYDEGENAAAWRSLYVEATAYSPYEDGNGSRTTMGTLVRRGIIAADPQVIPLGTKVYIPGYGMATVEDTGGSIRGNRIDVAFDTYGECIKFGRQSITIYIVE